MTEIELRYNLLTDVREMLLKQWEDKREVERKTAEFEERAPKKTNLPTTRRIMRIAEELYDFVHQKNQPEKPAEVDPEFEADPEFEVDDPDSLYNDEEDLEDDDEDLEDDDEDLEDDDESEE